jgi:hypothetical protein
VAGVEKGPAPAAVAGVEQLGFFFVPAAQDVGFGGAESADAAEIERFGFWYVARVPALSGVDGEEHCALRAAGPDGISVYGVDAAEACALGSQPEIDEKIQAFRIALVAAPT